MSAKSSLMLRIGWQTIPKVCFQSPTSGLRKPLFILWRRVTWLCPRLMMRKTWTVSDAVTAIAGSGSIVVKLTEGDKVKTTGTVQTITLEGHAAAGSPPTPIVDWIEDANETLDALKAVEFTTNGKYLEVNL